MAYMSLACTLLLIGIMKSRDAMRIALPDENNPRANIANQFREHKEKNANSRLPN